MLVRLSVPESAISVMELMWERTGASPGSLGDTLLANDLAPVASRLDETAEIRNPADAPVIESVLNNSFQSTAKQRNSG